MPVSKPMLPSQSSLQSVRTASQPDRTALQVSPTIQQPTVLMNGGLTTRQRALLSMQQTRGNAAVVRALVQRRAAPEATVQRDEPDQGTDERANDPNFLLCLALCELGIPAPLWRNLMRDLLELVSAEYGDRYGEVQGSVEFQNFRREFQAYSTFNLLKFVLTLLVQGKIGPMLVIRSAGARAIQERILARLAAAGLRTTGIVAAEQIIRKVSVYIELAVAAGCTAYCGTMAYANTMLELTNGMVAALVDTVDLLNAVGRAGASIMGQIFVRPVLVTRASVDATNWDTTALPRAAVALQLVGNLLWSQMEPNDPNHFLTNSQRLMSSFNIPLSVLQEIATEMTQVVQARGGFNASMTFTAELLRGLSVVGFVQLLRDWHVLNFVRAPETIADEQMRTPATPAPAAP